MAKCVVGLELSGLEDRVGEEAGKRAKSGSGRTLECQAKGMGFPQGH